MLNRPLISVHFPKAGGTALQSELVRVFGESNVLTDYSHDPVDPANPLWIDRDLYLRDRPVDIHPHKAVHGHFPAIKYDLVPKAYRIVMLREPVENIISIYYYWCSLFDTPARSHAIYEYAKELRPSLLELAQIPELRWLLSKSYFGNYDMRQFNLIGAHDRRAEFFAAISSAIGRTLHPGRLENLTTISEERGNVSNDTKLTAQLRDLLRDDILFYERHTSRPSRPTLARLFFASTRVLRNARRSRESL